MEGTGTRWTGGANQLTLISRVFRHSSSTLPTVILKIAIISNFFKSTHLIHMRVLVKELFRGIRKRTSEDTFSISCASTVDETRDGV